jgi:hypothetical protein
MLDQPPEAQAIIRLLLAKIAELESRIEQLKRQGKGKTPQNSSLPPSTQHPHSRPQPPKRKSRKKRGGQPGHEKHERPAIPTDQCDDVQTLKPAECRRCGQELWGNDPQPLRHQVGELPEIKPHVTEYQRHRLCCPNCGETTCAELPVGVPQGQSGPRLMALTALLMAFYRQSKRRTAGFFGTQSAASSRFVETMLTVILSSAAPQCLCLCDRRCPSSSRPSASPSTTPRGVDAYPCRNSTVAGIVRPSLVSPDSPTLLRPAKTAELDPKPPIFPMSLETLQAPSYNRTAELLHRRANDFHGILLPRTPTICTRHPALTAERCFFQPLLGCGRAKRGRVK